MVIKHSSTNGTVLFKKVYEVFDKRVLQKIMLPKWTLQHTSKNQRGKPRTYKPNEGKRNRNRIVRI